MPFREVMVLDRKRSAWLDVLTPIQILAICFLAAITVGTILLWLPLSTADGQRPMTFIDSLFTATSSVCVTGLIVVDTGPQFSGFGEGVILLLIQLGGLGTMTASTIVLLALGQRASLRNLNMLRDEYTVSGIGSTRRLILVIVAFTVIAEAAGAVILTRQLSGDPRVSCAAWSGIFHSVSAFCNAGFSLFPDSFTRYRGDLTVNLVVPLLIVFGGIGFPALIGLCRKIGLRLRGVRSALSLHAKIVFAATLVLLILGTAVFFGLESAGDELGGAPFFERLGAGWFQSVTTRTAGFNTIDFGRASEPTLLLAIVLMVIGGSPGSTAGGVKTTTFVVIVLVVVARLRGHERVEAGGRTIPTAVITKALVVALLGVTLIATATLLLLITDGTAIREAAAQNGWTHGSFVSLLFEVVSAFGTVGLSVLNTAATGSLTWMGKLVIIGVMYLGRLGPLALAQMVLAADKPLKYRYPEEHLLVG